MIINFLTKRVTSMPTMRQIILCGFLTATSCQNTSWQDSPPIEFQGKFTQVSDGVIQGYQKPTIIEIDDKEFWYRSAEDTVIGKYPILKVSKTGDHVVIFCGDEDPNHIAEFRYEIFWDEDNYLHISEVVATGNNNDDGKFEIGKFTDNEFVKGP